MKIFNGIYFAKKLSDISKQIFNNRIWKKIVMKKIKNNKKQKYPIISSSPLNLIFSIEYFNKNVKILDFGSGALDIYFEINNIINACSKFYKKKFKKRIIIDFVELPEILKIYKKINFSKNFKINLNNSIPIKKKFDIIHISNSLHYVNEPSAFIKKIISMNAKYIIINSTKIGEYKKFITIQKFYDYKIPLWVFNLNELVREFQPKYKLVFVSKYLHKYLGKYTEIPMNNFPKKFRIDHTKTLIFKKN